MLAVCERGMRTTTTTKILSLNQQTTAFRPRPTNDWQWHLSGNIVTPWDHNLILFTHFLGHFSRTVAIFQDIFEFQDISKTRAIFQDIPVRVGTLNTRKARVDVQQTNSRFLSKKNNWIWHYIPVEMAANKVIDSFLGECMSVLKLMQCSKLLNIETVRNDNIWKCSTHFENISRKQNYS